MWTLTSHFESFWCIVHNCALPILFLFSSELFKAKTLEFFSKTLPILKADDTLPKVARYEDNHISQNPTLFHSKPGSRITFYHHRTSRSVQDDSEKEEALNDESKKVNIGAQCGKTRNSPLLKKYFMKSSVTPFWVTEHSVEIAGI